eukprot:XP_001694811.1 predicted protein [Chlamydomonas reinhardtii]
MAAVVASAQAGPGPPPAGGAPAAAQAAAPPHQALSPTLAAWGWVFKIRAAGGGVAGGRVRAALQAMRPGTGPEGEGAAEESEDRMAQANNSTVVRVARPGCIGAAGGVRAALRCRFDMTQIGSDLVLEYLAQTVCELETQAVWDLQEAGQWEVEWQVRLQAMQLATFTKHWAGVQQAWDTIQALKARATDRLQQALRCRFDMTQIGSDLVLEYLAQTVCELETQAVWDLQEAGQWEVEWQVRLQAMQLAVAPQALARDWAFKMRAAGGGGAVFPAPPPSVDVAQAPASPTMRRRSSAIPAGVAAVGALRRPTGPEGEGAAEESEDRMAQANNSTVVRVARPGCIGAAGGVRAQGAGDSYAEKLSISCAGAGVRERNGGALGAEGGTAHRLELVQEPDALDGSDTDALDFTICSCLHASGCPLVIIDHSADEIAAYKPAGSGAYRLMFQTFTKHWAGVQQAWDTIQALKARATDRLQQALSCRFDMTQIGSDLVLEYLAQTVCELETQAVWDLQEAGQWEVEWQVRLQAMQLACDCVGVLGLVSLVIKATNEDIAERPSCSSVATWPGPRPLPPRQCGAGQVQYLLARQPWERFGGPQCVMRCAGGPCLPDNAAQEAMAAVVASAQAGPGPPPAGGAPAAAQAAAPPHQVAPQALARDWAFKMRAAGQAQYLLAWQPWERFGGPQECVMRCAGGQAQYLLAWQPWERFGGPQEAAAPPHQAAPQALARDWVFKIRAAGGSVAGGRVRAALLQAMRPGTGPEGEGAAEESEDRMAQANNSTVVRVARPGCIGAAGGVRAQGAGNSYAEKLSISCAGAGVRERNGGALGAEGGTAHGLELVQEESGPSMPQYQQGTQGINQHVSTRDITTRLPSKGQYGYRRMHLHMR